MCTTTTTSTAAASSTASGPRSRSYSSDSGDGSTIHGSLAVSTTSSSNTATNTTKRQSTRRGKKTGRATLVTTIVSLLLVAVIAWTTMEETMLMPWTAQMSMVETMESKNLTLRFCRQPRVSHNNVTLQLLYQCQGSAYEEFGQQLWLLAQEESRQNWGHRSFPLPKNRTVLVLGNSHLRQISKTLVCQYASEIAWMHPDSTPDVFGVQFQNGATLVSVTNTVLVYSQAWKQWIQQEYLQSMLGSNTTVDAVIVGKFTRLQEAQHTNFEITMQQDQDVYYKQYPFANMTTTTRIDFATIPPPRLVTVAQAFSNTTIILSVPMFSKSDQARAAQERLEYYAETNATTKANVTFIDTRHYIDKLGLECGSDDKLTTGTCHEPPPVERPESFGQLLSSSSSSVVLAPRNPADMHRCAGPWGGHADLVAWSIVEGLYHAIEHVASDR